MKKINNNITHNKFKFSDFDQKINVNLKNKKIIPIGNEIIINDIIEKSFKIKCDPLGITLYWDQDDSQIDLLIKKVKSICSEYIKINGPLFNKDGKLVNINLQTIRDKIPNKIILHTFLFRDIQNIEITTQKIQIDQFNFMIL